MNIFESTPSDRTRLPDLEAETLRAWVYVPRTLDLLFENVRRHLQRRPLKHVVEPELEYGPPRAREILR